MNRAHVPVLAGELIELTDPAAGETVVDCTFGAGGHARLIADRHRLRRHARLHRPRPRGRGALRGARAPRSPARRASCAWTTPTGSTLLREEGSVADLVYLDLGISSMQVDARERGFSYSYDAPLDMRMDPEPGARRARDREHLGRAPAGPAVPAPSARTRNAQPDRARDRAPPRARADSRRPASWSRRSRPPCPPRCAAASAAAARRSASSRRSGSR